MECAQLLPHSKASSYATGPGGMQTEPPSLSSEGKHALLGEGTVHAQPTPSPAERQTPVWGPN